MGKHLLTVAPLGSFAVLYRDCGYVLERLGQVEFGVSRRRWRIVAILSAAEEITVSALSKRDREGTQSLSLYVCPFQAHGKLTGWTQSGHASTMIYGGSSCA
jgi:hypothetical protein